MAVQMMLSELEKFLGKYRIKGHIRNEIYVEDVKVKYRVLDGGDNSYVEVIEFVGRDGFHVAAYKGLFREDEEIGDRIAEEHGVKFAKDHEGGYYYYFRKEPERDDADYLEKIISKIVGARDELDERRQKAAKRFGLKKS